MRSDEYLRTIATSPTRLPTRPSGDSLARSLAHGLHVLLFAATAAILARDVVRRRRRCRAEHVPAALVVRHADAERRHGTRWRVALLGERAEAIVTRSRRTVEWSEGDLHELPRRDLQDLVRGDDLRRGVSRRVPKRHGRHGGRRDGEQSDGYCRVGLHCFRSVKLGITPLR